MMVLPQEIYNYALDMFAMMVLLRKNLQQCVGHVCHDGVATRNLQQFVGHVLP